MHNKNMTTTLNEALEMAKQGNWKEAFDIAQKDEGLKEGVTFDQWKEFATKAIARRNND